jgi:hypothetical protein
MTAPQQDPSTSPVATVRRASVKRLAPRRRQPLSVLEAGDVSAVSGVVSLGAAVTALAWWVARRRR